jgi:SAM-dependent methyltransferase
VNDPSLDTRDTYNAIGARFIENARDRSALIPWLDRFAATLPRGALVLDVGAGPGIDSAHLRARGLRTISLDFSLGMLRAGMREFPGARVQGDARRLPVASAAIAGVWANASLLHLPAAEAGLALAAIHRVLEPRGLLYVSVKQGVGAEWESDRYDRRRFFQYWSNESLDAALDAAGFTITSADTNVRPRNTWLVRLASARAAD